MLIKITGKLSETILDSDTGKEHAAPQHFCITEDEWNALRHLHDITNPKNRLKKVVIVRNLMKISLNEAKNLVDCVALRRGLDNAADK